MAEASGLKTPTQAELVAFDRKRKGKTTPQQGLAIYHGTDARIGKLKDGRTHMAYKPEQVVDLESGALVSAVVLPVDQGDTKTLAATLLDAHAKLGVVKDADRPGSVGSFDLVANKGYHSQDVLKHLPDTCRSQISEPGHRGYCVGMGILQAVQRCSEIRIGSPPVRARRFCVRGTTGWSVALPTALIEAVCGARIFASWPMWRNVTLSILPGSIWGHC